VIWTIVTTEQFERKAVKLLKRSPQLFKQYAKTIQLLEMNPHHPSLRLHPLQGKLAGLHSVSINISYRVTLEVVVKDREVVLVNIGTHDEVYR
jgi:addiction module RelE/StbE family toxin